MCCASMPPAGVFDITPFQPREQEVTGPHPCPQGAHCPDCPDLRWERGRGCGPAPPDAPRTAAQEAGMRVLGEAWLALRPRSPEVMGVVDARAGATSSSRIY